MGKLLIFIWFLLLWKYKFQNVICIYLSSMLYRDKLDPKYEYKYEYIIYPAEN